MADQPGEITQLLREWGLGNSQAGERLFEIVLPDLQRMAHRYMKRERKDHTLQPTELVDQIYFRLVAARERDWQSRGHFFAIAARAMRRCLIDYARRRPDAQFVPLDGLGERFLSDRSKVEQAVTIDSLLDELAVDHPGWCSIVEMKYFLGLTDEEAAELIGGSVRSLQRQWQDARRWLFSRLESGK